MNTLRFESTVKKAYKLVSFSLILTQLIFNTPVPQAFAGDPSALRLPGAEVKPTTKGSQSQTPRGNTSVIESGIANIGQETTLQPPTIPSTNPLEPLMDPNQRNTPGELNINYIGTLIANRTIAHSEVVRLLTTARDTVNTFMNIQFANGIYSTPVQQGQENEWMDGNNSGAITNMDTLFFTNLLNSVLLIPPPPRQTVTVNFVAANVDSGAYLEHSVEDPVNGIFRNYVEGASAVNVPAGVTINIRGRLYMISDEDQSETLIGEQIKGATSQNDAKFLFKHTEAGTRYYIKYDIVGSSSTTIDYVGTATSATKRTNGAWGFDASDDGHLVGFYIQGYQPDGIAPNGLSGQTFKPYFRININGQTAEQRDVYYLGNGLYQVTVNSNGYVDFDPSTMRGRAEINFSIQQLVDKQCHGIIGSEGLTCGSTGPGMNYDIIDNRRVFEDVEHPIGVYNIDTFPISPTALAVRAFPVGWPPDAFTINPATGKPSWAIRVTLYYNHFTEKKVFILNPPDATGYHRLDLTGLPANTGGHMMVDIVDTRFLQPGAYVTPSIPIEYIYRSVSIIRVGPPADPWYRAVTTLAPTPAISAPAVVKNETAGTITIKTTVKNDWGSGYYTKYVPDPPYRRVAIDYWPVNEPGATRRGYLDPVPGTADEFQIVLTGANVFDGTNYAFQILTDDRGISGPTRVNGTFSTPTPVIGTPLVTRKLVNSVELEIPITNLAAGRTIEIAYWTTSPAGTPQYRTLTAAAEVNGIYTIELTGLSANTPYGYRITTKHLDRASATKEGTFTTAVAPTFSGLTLTNFVQQPYPASYNATATVTFLVNQLAGLVLKAGDVLEVKLFKVMPNSNPWYGAIVPVPVTKLPNGSYTAEVGNIAGYETELIGQIVVNGNVIALTQSTPTASFKVGSFFDERPAIDYTLVTISGGRKVVTVTMDPANIPSWVLNTEIRFKVWDLVPGTNNYGYVWHTLTRTSPTSNTFSEVLNLGTHISTISLETYFFVSHTGYGQYWVSSGHTQNVSLSNPNRQYRNPSRHISIGPVTSTTGINGRVNFTMTINNLPAGVTPTFRVAYPAYEGGRWVTKYTTISMTRSTTNPNVFTGFYNVSTANTAGTNWMTREYRLEPILGNILGSSPPQPWVLDSRRFNAYGMIV